MLLKNDYVLLLTLATKTINYNAGADADISWQDPLQLQSCWSFSRGAYKAGMTCSRSLGKIKNQPPRHQLKMINSRKALGH